VRLPPPRRILRETWSGINKHRVYDLAAMLTYYALFAVFPFAVFVVTTTLLVLPAGTLHDAFEMIAVALPGEVRSMAMEHLTRLTEAAGGGFAIVGAGLAIWGASRGAVALQRVLNDIHEVKETRPFWKVQLIAIATTVAVVAILLVALALLLVGPAVGHFLMDRFGLGAVFDAFWTIGRWLGAALLVMFVWGCLYYFLPNIKRRFRWVTPGAAIGVLLWLGASRAFIFYLQSFGDYEKTYGTLGAVIVFLTWLWLSSMALLVGGEIDDAIDGWRKQLEGSGGQVPLGAGEESYFDTRQTGAVPHNLSKENNVDDRNLVVQRETDVVVRDAGVGDLVKRVGDDISTLAKGHFELARNEVTTGMKSAVVDTAAILLGGIVALIGLAMLCVTAVVAAEPLIPALWLRLLIGALVYMALGGALIMGFVKKLKGTDLTLKQSKNEASRTAQVLKEQVQNG
jgi:membrane protein